MKAIIPGGSSAPILMPDQIDTHIDFESIAAAGSMAGSGAVIVIDDRTCMVQLALRVAEFYKHESCGKCTPCREGTRWGVDIIRRIEMGEAPPGRARPAAERAATASSASACARWATRWRCPVASYVTHFRDEFQRHIDEGGCPFTEHSPISRLYHERRWRA